MLLRFKCTTSRSLAPGFLFYATEKDPTATIELAKNEAHSHNVRAAALADLLARLFEGTASSQFAGLPASSPAICALTRPT